MSLLLSLNIANLVMEDLENDMLRRINLLPFYFRYIDDMITAVTIMLVDTVVEYFNAYHHL